MKEFFFLQIFCFNFITQYFICANLIQKLFDIQYNRSQRSLRMKNDHINLINLKIDFLFLMILDLLLDGDSITTEMVMHYLLGTYVAPLHESVRPMLYHNMSLSSVCCTITWVCLTYVAQLHESVLRMLYHDMSLSTYVLRMLYHNMSLSMTLSFILRCIKPLLYFFVPIHQIITKRANCGNSDNGDVMLVISTDITETVNNDGTCSNKCSNCSKINILRHLWTHPPLFLSSSTRRRQRLVSSTGSFVSTVLPRFDMIWYDMLSCCWNMIWRAILYCSELCWTVLYSSVLRCAVLFSVLFCSLLYCTY